MIILPAMITAAPLSMFQQLSSGIAAVRKVMFGKSVQGGVPVPLVMAASDYLRRWDQRFQALVNKWVDGKLFSRWPRVDKPKRQRAVKPDAAAKPKPAFPPRFPSRFGWFATLIRPDAYHFAAQLQAWIDSPEMWALLTAAPQAARLLRALCRMMGVKAPSIALPKRQRRRPSAPVREKPPRPAKWPRGKPLVQPGHTYPDVHDLAAWTEWARRYNRRRRRERKMKFKTA